MDTVDILIDPRENPVWKPASNGAGKRRFGAARFAGREWARDSRGNPIRVASFQSAQKLADRMNAKENA